MTRRASTRCAQPRALGAPRTKPVTSLGLAIVLAGSSCVEDGASVELGPAPVAPREPDGAREGSVTHAIAGQSLEGGEETIRCYSWTVDNDEALYVQAVHFENRGSVHHSNWFVVPQSAYEGPDGDWACDEREFDTLAAALSGTVLFAQSTQAWEESMQLTPGAVVKVPPRSRIVGELHLLNLSPADRETRAWLTLDLIHPWDVQTVLVPMQLTYFDLLIPPGVRSRFAGRCQLASDVRIHHVLPHYHASGDGFYLGTQELVVTPLGDQLVDAPIVEHEGFGAGPLGVSLKPPATVPGLLLDFSCSYTNRYDRPLTWGIGIDEMCTVLALAEAPTIYTGTVVETTHVLLDDDAVLHAGTCIDAHAPKGLAYELPTDGERGAPLYLPPAEDGVPPDAQGDACQDVDVAAEPVAEPTLEALRSHVFTPWCTFSACHGQAAAGGLFLGAANLHGQLLGHVVQGPTELPLVAPGDAENSWLYRVLARCDPGGGAAHMPRNAPVLLEDETVALVRAWIDAGAPP